MFTSSKIIILTYFEIILWFSISNDQFQPNRYGYINQSLVRTWIQEKSQRPRSRIIEKDSDCIVSVQKLNEWSDYKRRTSSSGNQGPNGGDVLLTLCGPVCSRRRRFFFLSLRFLSSSARRLSLRGTALTISCFSRSGSQAFGARLKIGDAD